MATVDEISPAYVGEDKISLSLDPATSPAHAGVPVQINIDYSSTEPEGVVFPLELIVSGPSYQQKIFRKLAPPSLTIVVEEPGEHLVLFRELGHNRWQGRLLIDVIGDTLQTTDAS